MRQMNAWERLWEQLNESTEGPTVTLQVPREVADQLLTMLASSLEIDDDGETAGMDHEEPDADDFGGPPDGDSDDMGFSPGDDDEFDFPAGDDDEDEDNEDDSEPESEDDEDEDDNEDDEEGEETDEASDYSRSGGNPSGLRTQTALGESRRRTINERYEWRTPVKSKSPSRRRR